MRKTPLPPRKGKAPPRPRRPASPLDGVLRQLAACDDGLVSAWAGALLAEGEGGEVRPPGGGAPAGGGGGG